MKGNFQIIVLVIFIGAAVFGLLAFSGAIPLGSKKNTNRFLGYCGFMGNSEEEIY